MLFYFYIFFCLLAYRTHQAVQTFRVHRLLLTDFKPFQKPTQLPQIQLHDFCGVFRPAEKLLLQPLVPETKPIAVPVQDFDHIPAAIAKGEQVTGERIELKLVFRPESTAR